jgi:FAD/FMN-containing dehydrogenase
LKAVPELMNKGAFFSRPYGQYAGLIYKRDAVTVKSLKKVKAIHDPNNIMNPGKLCF